MTSIRQILESKGGAIWSVAPDTKVYAAIALMAEKGIGALLVMDGAGVVGVMSERDYARKMILQGRSPHETAVRDIMSSGVVTVAPGASVEECMAIMTEKRIRHLPVIEDGRLLGMISIGDIVKSLMAEQQQVIEDLKQYISS